MATSPPDANASFLGPGRLRVEILNRGEASFAGDLQDIVEALQVDRQQSLEATRRLHLAAQLLLQGEAARLAALVPDDPRVAALRAGAVRALEQSQLLAHEAVLAGVRIPRVRRTEALLHGRVTDDADRPVGPLTVTLVDAQGEALEGVAPVDTDAAGYYALVVPAEVASRLQPDAQFAVRVQHGATQVAPRFERQALQPGVVRLQDVALTEDDLKKLKLRSDFPPLRPRRAPRKTTGRGDPHDDHHDAAHGDPHGDPDDDPPHTPPRTPR